LGSAGEEYAGQKSKSFLVLFFKKEPLSSGGKGVSFADLRFKPAEGPRLRL
jgi:hypothetical protein